jgi:hypothetical protein
MRNFLRPLITLLALMGGAVLAQENVPAQPHPVVMPPPSTAELQYRQTCELFSTRLPEAVRQAKLPFLLLAWRIDAACAPTIVDFAGTGDVDTLQRALAQAGLNVQVRVSSAPPVVFPPAGGETWPLTPEVAPIPPQKMGGILEVPVRLRNMTFLNQKLFYGAGVLGYVLLNEKAEAVRWDGDGLNILVGYLGTCPALATCGLRTVKIPLDQFNADLPLPPGHYTLRLRINRLSINSLELSTTLPDLPFDILP